MERVELKGKAFVFLLFLWFLWFTNMAARVIFAPILPLVEDEFMISHARASSIFVFQAVGYSIAMLFSGFYSGRFGYKKSIAVSLSITALLFMSMPFIKVFSLLYAFNFIMGFSIGLYLPAAFPLITEYFVEKHWGRSIAIHDSGASVGIFCIPFIALFLLNFVPWRGIFPVFAAIFVVTALICFTSVREVKVRRTQKNVLSDLLKQRSLWIMQILFIAGSSANLGVYAIAPLYLTKELSMSVPYANHVLGISRLGTVGVAAIAGLFVDRIDLQKTTFFILVFTGVLTIIMGLAPVGSMGVVLFLQAVAVTGFFPLSFVLAAKTFTSETRSLAAGLTVACSMLFSGGLVPFLLGLSGDLVSFRFGITVLGVLVCLSGPLTYTVKIKEAP